MDDIKNQNSTSAMMISGNEDLLMEILIRLSPKHLIKFKSVSKHWKSLISNPHFAYLHTRRHPKLETSLLLGTSPSQMIYFHPKHSQVNKIIIHRIDFDNAEIIQSCNGLFLISQENGESYCVYNPSTRICRNVLLQIHEDVIIKGLSLVFDPLKSPYYKIVCVRTTGVCMCCYEIEVYESSTRTCSRFGERFKAPDDVDFSRGVYWNERIYWRRPKGHLFFFDLQKGCVGKMKTCPVRTRGNREVSCVKVWKDHLYCIKTYGGELSGRKKVSVFEMQSDRSHWSLKFNFEYSSIPMAQMNDEMFSVLGMIKGDSDGKEEEESAVVFQALGKVMVCKVLDRSFMELVDLREKRFCEEWNSRFGDLDACEFAHTLAPV